MLKVYKYIILIVITIFFISCKKEKAKSIRSIDIYQSYDLNKKATYFNVPPGLVSIFLDESQPGNAELKSLLKDTKQLSFLIFTKPKGCNMECKYYNELNFRLDSIKFRDLAQINNGKEIVRVKVDKHNREYKELVVLVSNCKALYCISFQGDITPKKVVNLVKPENVRAVTNLDRFNR